MFLSVITCAGGAAWARCSRAARAESARVLVEPSFSPPESRTTVFGGSGGGVGVGVGAGAGVIAGVGSGAAGFGVAWRGAGDGGDTAQPAASRARRSSSGAAVAVFETNHIFELRGRHLDDVAAVLACDHPVLDEGTDPVGLAATEGGRDQVAVLFHEQLHLAVGKIEGLVLDFVVL